MYFLLQYNAFLDHIRVFTPIPYSLPHPQSICNHQLFCKVRLVPHHELGEAFQHCFPTRSLPLFLALPVTSGVLPVPYFVSCFRINLQQKIQVAKFEVLWDARSSQLVISYRRCWGNVLSRRTLT